jgi:hypothetical protein
MYSREHCPSLRDAMHSNEEMRKGLFIPEEIIPPLLLATFSFFDSALYGNEMRKCYSH